MKKISPNNASFIIMCDIEKRAKVLTEELKNDLKLICGDSIDGYKYVGKNWREAKEAGFKKEADGKWIGFVNHGDGAYSERAYRQALEEYKTKLPNCFLQNVFTYEYLL